MAAIQSPFALLQIEPAVRHIQNGWRFSTAGVYLLRHHCDHLAKVPHLRFEEICQKLLRPLLRRGRKENRVRQKYVESLIQILMKRRKYFQSPLSIPICIEIDPMTEIPRYQLKESPLSAYRRLERGHVYLSEKVHEYYISTQQPRLTTKKQLDAFTRVLYENRDICPCLKGRNAEGCYAVAQIILDSLHLWGVSRKLTGKQYIVMPLRLRSEAMRTASFHMGAFVKGEDGEWIFDLSLAKDRVLSLQEWAALQTKRPSETPAIVNIGTFHKSQEVTFICDPKKECVAAVVACDLHLKDLDLIKGTAKVVPLTEENRNCDLRLLAVQRAKAEIHLLKQLFSSS